MSFKQTPPGQDSAGPALPPLPEIPPIREFTGRRYVDGKVEEFTIQAHTYNLLATGGVQFLEYVIFNGEPTNLVALVMSDYIDFKETPPLALSNLGGSLIVQ
jgi:hypothetical protein